MHKTIQPARAPTQRAVRVAALVLASLLIAGGTSSTATAKPSTDHLTKTEAFAAAVTISPGRTYELAAPLVPNVEYRQVMIVADPSGMSRLGRRAVMVNARVFSFRPHVAPIPVGLLVRKRLGGRIVVRVASRFHAPALAAAALADPVPTLTHVRAKALMRVALKHRFHRQYVYGSFKHMTCHRRSRVRIRCRVVWGAGDIGYGGKLTAVYFRSDASRVVGRIKRTDWYAVQVEHHTISDSSRWYRVHRVGAT